LLHVGQPCPSRLVVRERHIVAILLGTSLEETRLRAFERLRDRVEC